MIIRIVELEINLEEMESAELLLIEVAPKVRGMAGCSYLEIIQDVHKLSRVTTYSHWDSEEDLNAYRDSEVFLTFWNSIKPMFQSKARAWSSERLIHKP